MTSPSGVKISGVGVGGTSGGGETISPQAARRNSTHTNRIRTELSTFKADVE
jgi:hypothetical protein